MSKDCKSCNDKDFDHDKWSKEMMEKHGWYVHYISGDQTSPTQYNFHTHGIETSFGHLDFQIVVPVPQSVAHVIFNNVVKLVKNGEVFKVNTRYSNIINDYDVLFIKVSEGKRDVLRIILPDKDGNLEPGSFVIGCYESQYLIVSEEFHSVN